MFAEDFILISKHFSVKEKPRAARVLQDKDIRHKNAQPSYLNRLRHQSTPQTTTNNIFTENAELLQESPNVQTIKNTGRTC